MVAHRLRIFRGWHPSAATLAFSKGKRLVAWTSGRRSPAHGKAGSGKKGRSTTAVHIIIKIVRKLVRFQERGGKKRLESVWIAIEGHVEKPARAWLVKHRVTGSGGLVDVAGLADVKQRVARKLAELPKQADRAGWYDPAPCGWKPDRLRAWLYPIVRNEAVEHYKQLHGLSRPEISTVTFGDFEFNQGVAAESLLKPAPKVDFDAFELQEIVAEYVAQLPGQARQLYLLLFGEGLSQRRRQAGSARHLQRSAGCGARPRPL